MIKPLISLDLAKKFSGWSSALATRSAVRLGVAARCGPALGLDAARHPYIPPTSCGAVPRDAATSGTDGSPPRGVWPGACGGKNPGRGHLRRCSPALFEPGPHLGQEDPGPTLLPRVPAMVWLLPLPVSQPVSCIRQPIARAGHGLRQASCSVLSGVGGGGGRELPRRDRGRLAGKFCDASAMSSGARWTGELLGLDARKGTPICVLFYSSHQATN
jgi:hypothetical protein